MCFSRHQRVILLYLLTIFLIGSASAQSQVIQGSRGNMAAKAPAKHTFVDTCRDFFSPVVHWVKGVTGQEKKVDGVEQRVHEEPSFIDRCRNFLSPLVHWWRPTAHQKESLANKTSDNRMHKLQQQKELRVIEPLPQEPIVDATNVVVELEEPGVIRDDLITATAQRDQGSTEPLSFSLTMTTIAKVEKNDLVSTGGVVQENIEIGVDDQLTMTSGFIEQRDLVLGHTNQDSTGAQGAGIIDDPVVIQLEKSSSVVTFSNQEFDKSPTMSEVLVIISSDAPKTQLRDLALTPTSCQQSMLPESLPVSKTVVQEILPVKAQVASESGRALVKEVKTVSQEKLKSQGESTSWLNRCKNFFASVVNRFHSPAAAEGKNNRAAKPLIVPVEKKLTEGSPVVEVSEHLPVYDLVVESTCVGQQQELTSLPAEIDLALSATVIAHQVDSALTLSASEGVAYDIEPVVEVQETTKDRKALKKERKIKQKALVAERAREHEQAERSLLTKQIQDSKSLHEVKEQKKMNWKEIRQQEVKRDYEAGRYAYVSAAPYEWPFSCTQFSKKDEIDVYAYYKYATDAYGSDHRRMDIAALDFGEEKVQLQDISLASRLVHAGVLAYVGSPALQKGIVDATNAATQTDFNTALAEILSSPDVDAASVGAAVAGAGLGGAVAEAASAVLAGNYLITSATKDISFHGKKQEYKAFMDFARYIIPQTLRVGIQVPIVYRKNTLTSDFPYIEDVLSAKGIHGLGGSAAGLGDIELFAAVDIGTRTFKKATGGLQVTLPTGKKATTKRLWAPALGDGYPQITLFTGLMAGYNRFVNPHMYLEGSYSFPARFHKRVPVLVSGGAVTVPTPTTQGDPNNLASITVADKTTNFSTNTIEDEGILLNNTIMSMGDRVQIKQGQAATRQLFPSQFDSLVGAFGDRAFSVRMVPGLEFNFIFGNIIERVFLRQGFLGFAYGLHVRFSDGAHGLDSKNYDLAGLDSNTAELAHKIGINYNYLFDDVSCFCFGIDYAFAGTNIPKTFTASAILGYSF